ncbi:YraN family protein [Neisseriaceae bacterium TC5R-5]|nr:YraN family protein [Neisseriaceae bacterium TC5R-5]
MNKLGQQAEDRALAFLQARGLTLVERNWSCRAGELDLVMRDQAHWVFVEVRHRASERFGSAAQSITPAKRRKLEQAAAMYLSIKGLNVPCRFDAVLTVADAPPEWLKNIFI